MQIKRNREVVQIKRKNLYFKKIDQKVHFRFTCVDTLTYLFVFLILLIKTKRISHTIIPLNLSATTLVILGASDHNFQQFTM